MRYTNGTKGNARRLQSVALASALTLLATFSACKSPTDFAYPSTLTLVSGGNQTVTINPGGLADLPQPVVVRLERHGKPVKYNSVSAGVASAASSATPRYYYFFTGEDGIATMQLQADDIPGPFNIDVTFQECSDGGLFCDQTVVKATLHVTGTAVN